MSKFSIGKIYLYLAIVLNGFYYGSWIFSFISGLELTNRNRSGPFGITYDLIFIANILLMFIGLVLRHFFPNRKMLVYGWWIYFLGALIPPAFAILYASLTSYR